MESCIWNPESDTLTPSLSLSDSDWSYPRLFIYPYQPPVHCVLISRLGRPVIVQKLSEGNNNHSLVCTCLPGVQDPVLELHQGCPYNPGPYQESLCHRGHGFHHEIKIELLPFRTEIDIQACFHCSPRF